jgi:FAD/FMN-containing dehydrogenase
MALGLEVVLADGRILNGLSKLKKDNTGYDLRNLFIGAEGTLGIITAATLKLFPKPRAVETAYVGLKSPAQALKLLSISQNEAAGSLTSFRTAGRHRGRFHPRHGIDIRDPLTSKHPWYVLMELSSSRDDARDALESILAKGMEEGIVDDAVIAANLSQRAAFWKLRDEMSAAQKPEGGSIKHDISVPVAAVPDFIEEANAAVVKLIRARGRCRSAISATATSTTMSASRSAATPPTSSRAGTRSTRSCSRSCCGWADRFPPSTASACSSATNCPT